MTAQTVNDNERNHELEVKLAIPDSTGCSREEHLDAHRQIFLHIQQQYQAKIINKGTRVRTYLSDKTLKAYQHGFEIRHQEKGQLMIKWDDNTGTEGGAVMDRQEQKIKLVQNAPITCLADIETFGTEGTKLPESLVQLFKEKGTQKKLHPVVRIESQREKIRYTVDIEHDDRTYAFTFELAKDEGMAYPLEGEPYAIDQLELEIHSVIDKETGRDVLNAPDGSNLPTEVLQDILTEEAARYTKLGLEEVPYSKCEPGIEALGGTIKKNEALTAAREQYAASLELRTA